MSIQRKDIYPVLVFCYIVSLGFQSLFNLPYFGKKIQLPEVLFMTILSVFVFDLFKKGQSRQLRWTRWDGIILLYPVAVLLSSVVNGGVSTWIEFLGVLYLFLIYFLLKNILAEWSFDQIYNTIFSASLWGGALIAISCWIGWGMLYFFEATNELSFVYQGYPYLGDVIRVNGFLPSPHMVASILNISILFFLSKVFLGKRIRPIYYFLFILIASAYLLTLAKVVILLLLSIGVLFYQINKNAFSKYFKSLIYIFFPVLIAFYLFAIHFLVVKKEDVSSGKFQLERTHTGTSIAESENFFLYPTSYFALKKSAYILGKENPVFGIGLGNHESHLGRLREEGKYPQHMPDYAPHSTYMGAFAELGGLGISVVVFIFAMVGRRFHQLSGTGNSEVLIQVLIAIFFIAMIEGISTDILNFRQYWLVLAAAVVIFEKKDQPSKLS